MADTVPTRRPPAARAGADVEPAASSDRPDVVVGDDGRPRCGWGAGDPLYVAYHDQEWGRPLRDERALFGLLCLEAFQSGLSWITILRKRPAFLAAFDGFDPEVVAGYGEADGATATARAVVAMHDGGETLVDVVFGHAPPPDERPPGRYARLADLPAATPSSTALARDLRRRGFRFVGPVVAYSLMQAAGVVDDHLAGCWVAGELDAGGG